ncbi:MAG: hypothetical protein JO291_07085, partial [Acidimicrobiia bacterium]|nr:hypothetical protein [Acidimicrobiia bacterium]
VPSSTPGDSDPSVGIGANGTIYFGYQNSDGHPRVAVSHDKGKTWKDDQDVGRTFGIQNTVFPVMVAGDDNRAAFAFLGTPTGGNYQDAAHFKGVWHLYVATTLDGGKSWVTADATPKDAVQRGSICTAGTTCGDDRNLLDFNDITIDKSGRVLVAIADGCTGACVTSGPNTFDAKATIVRQTTGARLFTASSPRPDLALGVIQASRSSDGKLTLKVFARNLGGKAASNVRVRFTEGSRVIGTSAPVSLPGFDARLVSVSGSTISKGSHTFTAVIDPNNAIAESNEANNRARRTVAL